MKALWTLLLFAGLAAALTGCTITAAPMVYVPPPACPEGYYYASGYGCLPTPPGVVLPADAVYATVGIQGLNLRSCGSMQCAVINSLNQGEQVQVLSHEGDWTHVWAFSRGQEGWVGSRYLN